MLHDDSDGFRDHPLVEELRRNPRAFVAPRLSEQVDEVGHILVSIGFQKGPPYVPDASEPALKIRAVVIRGKGDRRALCRCAFQNARLVFLILFSRYTEIAPTLSGLPSLRHSFDLVVEPDAEMLGASGP